jgi:hypothetical protein
MRAAATSALSGKTVVCMLTGVALLIWARNLSGGPAALAAIAIVFIAFSAFGCGVGYLVAARLSRSVRLGWRSVAAVLDVLLSWAIAVNAVRFGEIFRLPLALALLGSGVWVGASLLVVASVIAPRGRP